MTGKQVKLDIQVSPISPAATRQDFIYKLPKPIIGADDGGITAQNWSMLGREDLGAESGSGEYRVAECNPTDERVIGWHSILQHIAAQATYRKIVILNESHAVTMHREIARRLLQELRPLGFRVFAIEALTHLPDGESPIDHHRHLPWPQQFDGLYTSEPVFGRLIRDAKKLDFRLAAYEQLPVSEEAADEGDSIQQREDAQVRNLVQILRTMAPEEKLFIYAGYSHANKVPRRDSEGRTIEWMAAGLKRATGIDPLTISQTTCRSKKSEPFLAKLPNKFASGSFDIVVSHPIEVFRHHRPLWRSQAGDISVQIPKVLQQVDQSHVVEAFAEGEPFDAVPVDRVLIRPGENIPLLLPHGRYRVRSIRLPN